MHTGEGMEGKIGIVQLVYVFKNYNKVPFLEWLAHLGVNAFFMASLIFLSCNNKVVNNANNINQEEQIIKSSKICSDSLMMQNLLQSVFDIESLQQYFLVEEVIDRGYMILLKNDIIKRKYKLNKLGQSVVYLSKDNIKSDQVTAYLEFTKLEVIDDEANVVLVYKTQGIRCSALFTRVRCNWKLKKSKIVET